MRRIITALLLTVIACVGIAGCTVPRGTTITSEDRQRAKDAAAASAMFDERERVCLSTRAGWDVAKCKSTEGQITSASEALKGVPDVCKKYPVSEDTCAEAIVAERVADGRVSPYDKVISPWRTAVLIGGIALALIVLGGGAFTLRRRSPQPPSGASRSTKTQRSTPKVRAPHPPVRRPSSPPEPFTAGASAPAPPPVRPQNPQAVTGEVVGYAAPPVTPAVRHNRRFTPKYVIAAVVTFVVTGLATFIVASAVVSVGTWIAGPPQPEWLHWLEWEGAVAVWPVALVLAVVISTLVVRATVKRDRSRR